MVKCLFVVVPWMLGAAAAQAQKPSDSRSVRVDSVMATLVKEASPGAAVLVIQNGKAIHEKGYGLADRDTKRPITGATTFDLASVSKQFTAMAIMMLAERGKLAYDDPLTKFFPDFPAYAAKITVRHLLTHTSGIDDYMEVYEKTAKGTEPTSRDALRMLMQLPQPRFEPGLKFEYSNSGYMVLAQVVEKASGMPFPAFMKQNVFEPLGMSSTIVSDQIVAPSRNRAISYSSGWFGVGFRNEVYTPLNQIYGDGNVNTSLEDMFKWDQALYTERLVKQKTLAEAFAPAKLNDGSTVPYGFGWRTVDVNGVRVLSHGGSWAGFRTHIIRVPTERFSVVVLSNLADFNPRIAAVRVANLYLSGKLPE